MHGQECPCHRIARSLTIRPLPFVVMALQWKTSPPRNLQKEWFNALLLRAPRGYPSAIVECATASLYERDRTIRLGKMSALSAFAPPDYYTKEINFFAFAEAIAAGRRPGSATGSGSAGCLHDRHYITHWLWCAAGPFKGVHPGFLHSLYNNNRDFAVVGLSAVWAQAELQFVWGCRQ